MAGKESIPALEKALQKQKMRLKKLKANRGQLAPRLAKLDEEIAALEGARPAAAPPERGTRPGRRRKGRGPALDTLIPQVLVASDKPMSVGEMAEAVLARGYKSSSKKFVNVVAQYVYKSDAVERVARGRYALKAAAAAPKRRKATKARTTKKRGARRKSSKAKK